MSHTAKEARGRASFLSNRRRQESASRRGPQGLRAGRAGATALGRGPLRQGPWKPRPAPGIGSAFLTVLHGQRRLCGTSSCTAGGKQAQARHALRVLARPTGSALLTRPWKAGSRNQGPSCRSNYVYFSSRVSDHEQTCWCSTGRAGRDLLPPSKSRRVDSMFKGSRDTGSPATGRYH